MSTKEVIQLVGKYYSTPVGPLCYNTEKILTTVLDKQNIEGFASIILKLANLSGNKMSQEQMLLSYQWLEHIAMYASQAAANPMFAMNFLKGINKALQHNSFLTGQTLTVTDIAAYYVLYPIVERLTVSEREAILHVCRWLKHVQTQPRVCTTRPPLPLNSLILSVIAPAVH